MYRQNVTARATGYDDVIHQKMGIEEPTRGINNDQKRRQRQINNDGTGGDGGGIGNKSINKNRNKSVGNGVCIFHFI